MENIDELARLERLAASGDVNKAVDHLRHLSASFSRDSRAFHKGVLRLLVRISRKQSSIERDSEFTRALLKAVRREHIQERLVRYFADVHDYSESFTESMIQRDGTVRRQKHAPDRILSKEEYSYLFARAAGAAVPKRYQFCVPKSELRPQEQCVIKPVGLAGSKGVHVIEYLDGIGYHDVSHNMTHDDWPDLVDSFETDIDGGAKSWSGLWLSEELIRSPVDRETGARDLKVYSFYGEIGLVLEISRWGDSKQYSWYDANLQRVEVGKYSNSPPVQPDILRSTNLDLGEISRMGKKIPAPFCRLDFLLGEHGPVLGELSFRPGQFHGFSDKYDRLLGSMFKRAEGRLADDLLHGVNFPEYEIVRRAFENPKNFENP